MRDNLFEIVTSSRTFYVQVRYLLEGYRSSSWELIILEGRELAGYENKQNIMTTAVIFFNHYCWKCDIRPLLSPINLTTTAHQVLRVKLLAVTRSANEVLRAVSCWIELSGIWRKGNLLYLEAKCVLWTWIILHIFWNFGSIIFGNFIKLVHDIQVGSRA